MELKTQLKKKQEKVQDSCNSNSDNERKNVSGTNAVQENDRNGFLLQNREGKKQLFESEQDEQI